MKMRKSQVIVLATLLLLLVCALTATAFASGDYKEDSTGKILVEYTGTATSVTIPDQFRTIGAGAFKGNTTLEEVTINKNITEMGAGAFEGCTSLKTVTIVNSNEMAEIPARAFKNCGKLTEITLSRSVKTIGAEAFYGCVGMKDVMGPDKAYKGGTAYYPVSTYVKSIGSNAFGNCPATIQCFKGSEMESYAKSNNLNYTSIDPIVYSIKAVLDPTVIIWDSSNPATTQLQVKVDPSLVSADSLGYSTSNVKIAKISETGLLTPVDPGTCSATVYSIVNNTVSTDIKIVVLDDRKGWQQWDGVWYYCKSRTAYATGWNQIGGKWYYFNKCGQMQTGWLKDGGVYYYLSSS